MYDNVKFFLSEKQKFEESVCKIPEIDLKTFLSPFTGEIANYPMIGKYFNLEVRITEKQAYIKGSLHKFINAYLEAENHNHNDFDSRDINLVIGEISNRLKINPSNTSVTNLEFGFNIELDEDPQLTIDNNVLMLNFKDHNKNFKYRGKGDFKEFEKTDYSVKIYNKSKQYNQNKHILRIEIKFTMKRLLEKLGVYTLSDLQNPDIAKKLFGFLLKTFDKLNIIDDFYQRDDIPKRDKERLTMLTNPNFHINALKTKTPIIRRRLEREFNSLIKKYNLDKTKQILRKKLDDKFFKLMRSSID